MVDRDRYELLGFVWELEFGGEGRGMEGLGKGKHLFVSFKKIRKGFGGVLEGLFHPILKFPKLGSFGGLTI